MRRGYDRISSAYRDDEGLTGQDGSESFRPYPGWIAELAAQVPPGGRVLDLGCGNGLPAARLLVEYGFATVGVDFSRTQVERARALVPGATFVAADMATWEADPASLDAVVSLYALIHLPLSDQRALIPRIASWLRPGGLVLAIVGHERWTGVDTYHGAPMFWDHEAGAAYEGWFEEASLDPLWRRYVPEGATGHDLILARRTDSK